MTITEQRSEQKSHEKKHLAIIWFSRTGACKTLALAAHDASKRESGISTQITCATDAQPEQMLDADGYIFICPENLAAIAGGMKEFFDRSYYPLLGKIEGRPYAAIITAGSDGHNAKQQLERIATGWRLKKAIDTAIICTHAQSQEAILAPKNLSDDQIGKARVIGETIAAGLALGVF